VDSVYCVGAVENDCHCLWIVCMRERGAFLWNWMETVFILSAFLRWRGC
jgi:hypothetical protein